MERKEEVEKAKAYEEIIKKATKIHSENCDACKACIEELIPELAESEDEKVKKELIKHLKEGSEGYEPAGGSNDYQRWLTWLEKQGEKPIKSGEWDINEFRTWQYIVSDVLTKWNGIGQYLDGGEYRTIAKKMQEEWSKKLA